MELKPLFQDIANAIREKDGTAEPIVARTFPERILGIPGGTYVLDIRFDAEFEGQNYTVTGPENEVHTGIVSNTLREFVTVLSGGTEYTVTCTTKNGEEFSNTVLTGSSFGAYSVKLEAPHIYGVRWDGTATTKWTRTDDAADFTDPVPYVAGSTAYGSPFDNLQPWAGMVKEERTAGTMVAIPKFWYQLYQNTPGAPSSGLSIKIADKAAEGFAVSPAHMDRGDGHGERDVVYVGRYHCAASDYKSKTGENPEVSITRATARTEIHKLGDNIWQMDFATRFTIWLLYLVEFADWNSQACIGYGCGSSGETGYTDSIPYHTGTTQSSRTTYGLGTQYRNIEGLWDRADHLDGCYNDSNGFYIILNPANYSDSEGGDITLPSYAGVPKEITVLSSGKFKVFYPSGGDSDTGHYMCDKWTMGDGPPAVRCGKITGTDDQRNGLFGISTNKVSYNSATRLQEL